MTKLNGSKATSFYLLLYYFISFLFFSFHFILFYFMKWKKRGD